MLKFLSQTSQTPVIDRTYGCDDARTLRQQFEKGKFAATELALRSVTGDKRCFLVNVLADSEDRPPRYDQWVDLHPDSDIARLTSGAQALEWAWQARTYSDGTDIGEEQWAMFYERLAFARNELEATIELAPSDPTAYGYLIRCAIGEEWDLDDVTSVYAKANELQTSPWLASFNYLTYLCKKWYGSHELMFDFARSVSNSNPDGADAHAMVAYAHIERWLYDWAFEENPAADDYWKSDEVFDELLDSYRRWSNKTTRTPWEKVAANAYLFCFSSMGVQEIMEVEINRIGPYPSFTPWRYLGDPCAVYRELCKQY